MKAIEALARALPTAWETGVDDHALDDARYILDFLHGADVVLVSRDELAAALYEKDREMFGLGSPWTMLVSSQTPYLNRADSIIAAIKEGQK